MPQLHARELVRPLHSRADSLALSHYPPQGLSRQLVGLGEKQQDMKQSPLLAEKYMMLMPSCTCLRPQCDDDCDRTSFQCQLSQATPTRNGSSSGGGSQRHMTNESVRVVLMPSFISSALHCCKNLIMDVQSCSQSPGMKHLWATLMRNRARKARMFPVLVLSHCTSKPNGVVADLNGGRRIRENVVQTGSTSMLPKFPDVNK